MASLDSDSASLGSLLAKSIRLITVTTAFEVCLAVIYAFLAGKLFPLNKSLKAKRDLVI
jgi:hypothetical protein